MTWLAGCDASHLKCRHGVSGAKINRNPELPTRVINVGVADDFEDLCLLVTNGRRGRYITLSHCWDKQNFLRTTKSSLLDYQRHIDYDALPNTFRDAILTTRKLGVRYLWID